MSETIEKLNCEFFHIIGNDGYDLGITYPYKNGRPDMNLWRATFLNFDTEDEALDVAVHWLEWIVGEHDKNESEMAKLRGEK